MTLSVRNRLGFRHSIVLALVGLLSPSLALATDFSDTYHWQIPEPGQKPYYASFVSLINAIDHTVKANQDATITSSRTISTTLPLEGGGMLSSDLTLTCAACLSAGGPLGTPSSGSAANLTSFPTLNQNTTGSAATLTTPRAIYGNNFDGSAALTQIIASTYGGTGNGFTKFSGPTTSEKTFTLPNVSTAIATNPWTADVNAADYTLYGSTQASGNLTLDSTSSGTKGYVLLNPSGGKAGIGTMTPETILHLSQLSGFLNISMQNGSNASRGYIGYKGTDTMLGINQDMNSSHPNAAAAAASLDMVAVNGDSWILFATTPTNNTDAVERMRIDKNGNVGIGTNSPTHLLQLNADDAAKPSTNTWTIASDARVKDASKARPFTSGLDVLRSMPVPHYFTYNGKGGTPKGAESVGWNAQDIREITPKMVREGHDPEHLLGVNTHELQYMTFNAIRELDARLTALESQKHRKHVVHH